MKPCWARLSSCAAGYIVGAIMAGCAAQPRIRSIVWDYNIIDEKILQAVTARGANSRLVTVRLR